MKKSTIFSILAVLGCAGAAHAQGDLSYMEPATLVYPDGLAVSMAPTMVDITYANQPIELVDPKLNDWGDECVTVFVKLDDGEAQPVSAGLLISYGDPGNPDDEDIYNLEAALYELDELFDFTGSTVTLVVPEGVVKNAEGAINPAQEFVFTIVSTYTGWEVTPESGSTLTSDLTVKINFGGNPIEYNDGSITLYHYEPSFEQLTFEFGKEVTISEDNELLIDFSSLENDFYEVVIPEGLVNVIEGETVSINPSLWLEYTVEKSGESGVTDVTASEKAGEIYTLQGVRVKNADAGIYIIDGKKVIVRK